MAERGVLDFSFTDDDYFNPWHATRAAVVWFGLELARARGDVPLAIRAYHRGFEAAHAGEGAAYLENVLRVRERYFASSLKSPTWRALRGWAWPSAPVPAGRDVEAQAFNRGGMYAPSRSRSDTRRHVDVDRRGSAVSRRPGAEVG